jgi:hypothetical protein
MVNKWNSIRDVKAKLVSSLNKPVNNPHIFYSTSPSELNDEVLLHDLGIDRSGFIFHLVFDQADSDVTLVPTQSLSMDSSTNEIVSIVKSGFLKHRMPTATDSFDGTGGVYFLREAKGSYCAVFKPHDEEQGMPNNPKNHTGQGDCGLREYFQPGQGCLRELAAYLFDEGHFCGVPATALVHCEHPAFHYPAADNKPKLFPKFGSMQEFVSDAEPFDDFGPNLLRFISPPLHFLCPTLPRCLVDSDFEVQKIALFDIRLLNCDRNAANILVRKAPSSAAVIYQLIPIDHGYCIPPKLKIFEWDWAWYYHPHVSRPVCPEILSYLRSIDIDQLLLKVSDHVLLTDDCQFLLRLSHFLLLHGLALGLTLKEIAILICRTGDQEDAPSQLEKLIAEAEDNAYRVIEITFHPEIAGSNNHGSTCRDTWSHGKSLSESPLPAALSPSPSLPSPNVEYSPLRRRSTSSLSHNNLKLLGTETTSNSPHPSPQSTSEQGQGHGSVGKQMRSSSEDNTLYLSHAATGTGAGSGKLLRSPKRKNSRHSSFPAAHRLPTPQAMPVHPLSPLNRVRGVSLLSTDSESQTSLLDPFEFTQRPSLDSIASTTASSVTSVVSPAASGASVVTHGAPPTMSPPFDLIVCPNPKLLASEFSSLQRLFPADALGSHSRPPAPLPLDSDAISASSPLSPTTILSSFQRVPVTKNSSFSGEEVIDIQIVSQFRMDSTNTDYSTDAASVSAVSAFAVSHVDDEIFLEDCFDCPLPRTVPSQEHEGEGGYGFFTSHLPHSSSSPRDDTPSSLFDVNLPDPIPLSRVASFCGFDSSPLCHHETTPVRNGTTRMEKRRLISETEQFKKLREEYAELFTLKLLRRMASSAAASAASASATAVPLK